MMLKGQSEPTQKVYIVTYLSVDAAGWPLDVGDDPSFHASAAHRAEGGVLTWGVCRPEVRNNVQPGDLVIFFAHNRTTKSYHFVAFATVDRKISQEELWKSPKLAVYRHYRNLLIRPVRNGFQHFEPQSDPKHWHKDWLWRTIDRHGLKKEQCQTYANDVVGSRSTLSGRPIRFAANYILFRHEGYDTYIMAQPPVVADAHSPGMEETWQPGALAQDLRKLVLGSTSGRSLRSRNRQQPHRHIVIRNTQVQEWLDRLHELCTEHNLKPRHA